MKPEEHTKDLLVKKKLGKGEEFSLHYEFSIPKEMPNGVFILKFQMVDPFQIKSK